MSGLVGDSHQAALAELVAAYKRVAGGKTSELVVLTARVGRGKTRVVHEFYAQLASHHQPDGAAYWPPVLVEDPDRGDPTKARKKTNPGKFLAKGGSDIPYLWWGLSCQRRPDGRFVNAVADDISQLIAHLDPVLRHLERKAETKAQFKALVGALFTAIPFPGAAGLLIDLKDAPAAALGLVRSGLKSEPGSADARMVDPSGTQDELLDRWVPALCQALESAGVPMVVFVDDAQWADPSTIEFLDRLLKANAPALVVITAGSEELDLQSHNLEESDTGSFVKRWEDRLTPLEVDPLSDLDLAEVAAAALGIDSESALATQLARRANNNPLLLRLWADVDFVASAAAGGNGLDDANLGRLPATVHDAYLHRWDALPKDVRRVLSAGACLGSEFVPAVLADCVDATGLAAEAGDTASAIARAAEHCWTRSITDDVDQFTEPILHEIASEKPVLSAAQQKAVRLAFCDLLAQLKEGDRWGSLSVRAGSVLLGSHIAATALAGAGRVDDDITRIVVSHLQLGDIQTESLDGWERRCQLYDDALSHLEAGGCADGELALRVRGRLALTIGRMGQATKALSLQKQHLTDSERIHGARHHLTQISRHNLAGHYLEMGRADKALLLFEEVHAGLESIFESDHPEVLSSRNSLATCLEMTGQAKEALPIFEQNLKDRVRVLGTGNAEHPQILASRNNLAGCYESVGRTGKARRLFKQNLEARERTLGADHPDTLYSRHNLAVHLFKEDQPGKALPLFEQNLEARARILGADHPETLRSRNNFAICFKSEVSPHEALPHFEQNLRDSERVLGPGNPDHPDILVSRNNLADCYASADQPYEALLLFAQNLEVRKRTLGTDHADTRLSRLKVVGCLKLWIKSLPLPASDKMASE